MQSFAVEARMSSDDYEYIYIYMLRALVPVFGDVLVSHCCEVILTLIRYNF